MTNLDNLVEATKKQPTKKADNNDTLLIAETIGKAIADKLSDININNKVEVTANPGVTATLELNKKIQDKAAKQIAFQKNISADLNANRNCRMYAIPKIYKEYQPSFVVSINGCTIKVPADVVPRKIHNRYIDIIEQRLRYLDEKIEAMNTSNIQLIPR